MRRFVALIWLAIVAVMLAAVAVPSVWLYTAHTLPNPIEGADDIERLLRSAIESDRRSVETPKQPKERLDVSWATPDAAALPRVLKALIVTDLGCPQYAESPRDTPQEWKLRLLDFVRENPHRPGDGACELIFSVRLAKRLGAVTPLQLAVAADRVHAFLSKDELLAYDLASQRYGPGLFGPGVASTVLMQKPLAKLNTAELVELQLAIPPHSSWDEVYQCTNAPLLRRARDLLLTTLVAAGHLTAAEHQAAVDQPVRCLSVKR